MDHLIAVPGQLAAVLRSLRRLRGLTQQDMAMRLGVTRQAVSELERAPHRATVERLHRALSVLEAELVVSVRRTGREDSR